MRIDQLAFLPSMTIGMAASTLAGQNIGAKRYDRVHDVFRWGLFYGWNDLYRYYFMPDSTPFSVEVFLKDPVVIHLGENYLRIIGEAICCWLCYSSVTGSSMAPGILFATTFFHW
jgi:Na+-driven multidrug efflux pump